MEWVFFIVGGSILVIIVLVLTRLGIHPFNFKSKISTPDQYKVPKSSKIGIVRGKIDYKATYTHFDIDYVAQVREIKRYNDKVEVEYIQLLNVDSFLSSSFDTDILNSIRRRNKLINYEDVEWEFNAPDILLERDMFRELINKGSINVYDIEIRIDEDIERGEMLDIIINETYGKA
jgi:hypothetical protein